MQPIKKYIVGRLKSLPPNGVTTITSLEANPIKLLGELNAKQWLNFILGFCAWTWDAFDFHSVTLSYPDLTKQFQRSETALTLAVTLAMMTRPLGGAFFGLLADKYGRRGPFIFNCLLLIVFELATGFCQTYDQFLAVRALFGFSMGGIYGNAAATALDDCPKNAQGLVSGVYQSGYPLGYALASGFYDAFYEKTSSTWRVLFWFGAAIPVLLIAGRMCLDETDAFLNRGEFDGQGTSWHGVWGEAKSAWRQHKLLLLYLILLLTGMVYLAHGTQDIYPLLMRLQYNYSTAKATRIQIVASLGGVLGSMVTGYISQFLGRRLSIILMCTAGGALLYPYTFATENGRYAAGFFIQFCVQGSWGVVPIYLIEMSPIAFRTLIVGLAYQVGVFFASPSNTIITSIAKRIPTLQEGTGMITYNYSIAISAFIGTIFACVIVVAALGPEIEHRAVARPKEVNDVENGDDVGVELAGGRRVDHGAADLGML